MSTNQFTGTTKVWLSSSHKSIQELEALVRNGETGRAVNYLSTADSDMSSVGWVQVGTASITVKLLDTSTVVEHQVAALKKELQEVRAEAQMKENAILARISKLQAIEYVEAGA